MGLINPVIRQLKFRDVNAKAKYVPYVPFTFFAGGDRIYLVILDQDPSTVAWRCSFHLALRPQNKLSSITRLHPQGFCLVTTRILLFFRFRKSQPSQAQSLDFWLWPVNLPPPPGHGHSREIAGPMNHWFPFIRPVFSTGYLLAGGTWPWGFPVG